MTKRNITVIMACLFALPALVIVLSAAPGAPAETFAPALWASPLALDFGPLTINSVGRQEEVTFINNGNFFLSTFVPGLVEPPFYLNIYTCDIGLTVGSTCKYLITFEPTEAGDFAATLPVETEAGVIAIALRGVGVGPNLKVNPLAFDFGAVAANSPGEQQVATVYNTGPAPMQLLSIAAPGGPFSTSNNCAAVLPPGTNCSVRFDFLPAAAGDFAGEVEIATDAGTATVALLGRGYTGPYATGQRATPRAFDFGAVVVGASSLAQKVTLTNQDFFTNITGWSIGQPGEMFAGTTNCPDALAPAGQCELAYTFAPTAAGTYTETVSIANSAGQFTVTLRGTGLGPDVTADGTTLEFGPVAPGATSPAQTVTIRNNSATESVTLFGGAPNPNKFGASTTCGGGLGPGETCEVFYTFKPTELGRLTGQSAFSTDAAGGNPFTIQLQGGVAFPQLALAFEPAAIVPDETATLRIAFANSNASQPLKDILLEAELPPGLVVADPSMIAVGPDCFGASFQPQAGGSALPFSGSVLGGRTCELAVDVIAAEAGEYGLSASATSESGPSNAAEATLSVSTEAESFALYLPLVR